MSALFAKPVVVSRASRGVCLLALVSGAAAALFSATGCQQYMTSPGIPTARGMSENPNAPAPEQVMTAALQYVATRWAPGKTREFDSKLTPGATYVDQAMVINLPLGTRQSFYDRIARKLGPAVQPATTENTDGSLPIYHVGRVWLRFEEAKVDVYRPMLELAPGADGQPVYQMVTVHLRGGFTPWRAEYARAWGPGDNPAPMVFYRPEQERPNEYELALKEYGLPAGQPATIQSTEAKQATVTDETLSEIVK